MLCSYYVLCSLKLFDVLISVIVRRRDTLGDVPLRSFPGVWLQVRSDLQGIQRIGQFIVGLPLVARNMPMTSTTSTTFTLCYGVRMAAQYIHNPIVFLLSSRSESVQF